MAPTVSQARRPTRPTTAPPPRAVDLDPAVERLAPPWRAQQHQPRHAGSSQASRASEARSRRANGWVASISRSMRVLERDRPRAPRAAEPADAHLPRDRRRADCVRPASAVVTSMRVAEPRQTPPAPAPRPRRCRRGSAGAARLIRPTRARNRRLAIDDRDLDCGLAAQGRQRHLAGLRGDHASASAGARFPAASRIAPALSAAPQPRKRPSDRRRPRPASPAERRRVDPASARMQVEMPGGELGELGEPARYGQPRDRMSGADISVCRRQNRPYRSARGRAGRKVAARRASDVAPVAAAMCVEPGGAGDVDAALDRMDPGRAGIGHDDPGGAEDRQPADDAEPRVHGLFGEALAAGDRDRDQRGRAAAAPLRLGELRGASRRSSRAAPG